MKTILLTGGSGFLGKSILNSYLKDKYDVLAPTHQELNLMDFNSTADYVFDTCPDIIIHAATLGDTPDALYGNTMMYQSISRFASLCDKLINISSGAVYDKSKDLDDVRENSLGLNVPRDNYGFSKFLNALQSAYNQNIVELIPFGIIGEYELGTRFVKSNIRKILHGESPTIRTERKMSYIDIKDFIVILDRFIENTRIDMQQYYNITNGKSIWLSDLYNIILEKMGKTIMHPSLFQSPSYTGSNAHLKEFMPDITFTPIELTVERMIAYCTAEEDL